jgi:hypothetical protein
MRAVVLPRPCYRALLAVGTLLAPNAGVAQLVTPRTVPVQQSGQFDIFPSQRASMAGVSLAIDDTLLDPFVNPAKTTRLPGVTLFTEIGGHSVTRGGGGGRTIPVGAIASRGPWSAGALLAVQSLDGDAVLRLRPSQERPDNTYASLLLARRMPRGISIGASAFRARLEGLDGIHAMYTGSDSVGLSGELSDVRAGAVKEWRNGQTAEVVLLHTRTSVSHDVRFPIGAWDPNTRSFSTIHQFEHHDDRTRVLGAHAEFVTRTSDSSRFGWLATVNRLTHPKIPNYRFSNLPRDPGTTYAYNFGFGVSKVVERSAFALDVVYEPMFSHTWAEAGPNATDGNGSPIPADMRTVENRFRFSNVTFALGGSLELPALSDTLVRVAVDLGLAVSRNSYRLRQKDNLLGAMRRQQVAWTEWGPTFGLDVRTRRIQVGYRMRLGCSPGACAIAIGRGDDVVVSPGGPGVIAAPGPVLGLDYGHVLIQKLSVTLPLHRW